MQGGFPEYGGSAKYPMLKPEKGTIIKIRDVLAMLLEKLDVPYEIVVMAETAKGGEVFDGKGTATGEVKIESREDVGNGSRGELQEGASGTDEAIEERGEMEGKGARGSTVLAEHTGSDRVRLNREKEITEEPDPEKKKRLMNMNRLIAEEETMMCFLQSLEERKSQKAEEEIQYGTQEKRIMNILSELWEIKRILNEMG